MSENKRKKKKQHINNLASYYYILSRQKKISDIKAYIEKGMCQHILISFYKNIQIQREPFNVHNVLVWSFVSQYELEIFYLEKVVF